MKQKRLKAGWFSFTCSGDNTIMFTELLNDHYFEWKDKIDFIYFRALRSKNKLTRFDIAFIEGAISSKYQEQKLKKIRKKAKILIAVGSCACNGSPSNQRNIFDGKKIEEIKHILDKFEYRKKVASVKEIVKVDYEVNGCPMNEAVFVETLNKVIERLNNKSVKETKDA